MMIKRKGKSMWEPICGGGNANRSLKDEALGLEKMEAVGFYVFQVTFLFSIRIRHVRRDIMLSSPGVLVFELTQLY